MMKSCKYFPIQLRNVVITVVITVVFTVLNTQYVLCASKGLGVARSQIGQNHSQRHARRGSGRAGRDPGARGDEGK